MKGGSMFAIGTDDAITYGDILLILGILALIAIVVGFFPRWRR